jgi:hypothetical protein
MPSYFLFHPAIAALCVIACYTNAYLGISRHLLVGGRRGFYLRFNRKIHTTMGRIFIVLILLAYLLGIAGIRQMGFPAFSSPHAYTGIVLILVFLYGAYFAMETLKGEGDYIKKHGRIMLFGAVLVILQILGGIANLKRVGLL